MVIHKETRFIKVQEVYKKTRLNKDFNKKEMEISRRDTRNYIDT